MKSTKTVSPWAVVSVTTLGAFLANIQSSALVLALPDVLLGLHATFETILWVLLGYLLITTTLVPLIGRLSDRWGRKNLYTLGFAVFTVASLGAGFSAPQWHGWDLLAWRLVQGLGGALLIANSTALVTDAFGKGNTGAPLGVNQMASASGFILGPLVGGLLTGISWQWVFWINVPLGVVGTLWAMRTLAQDRGAKETAAFDVRGTLLFMTGLTLFLTAVSFLAVPGSDLRWAGLLGLVGLVLLVLFFRLERRSAHPFLHLELFTNPRLSLPNLSAGLNALARGAVLFLLTFYLQGPLGMNPFIAGLATAPFGIAMLITSPWAGQRADKGQAALLSTGGLLVAALGLLGMAFVDLHTPYWLLALEMILIGAGSGLFNSPNISLIMGRVDAHHRGTVSGTRILVTNGGQMLALAIVFPFVLSRLPVDLMAKIFLYGGGLTSVPAVAADLVQGIRVAFFFSFVLALAAAVVSILTYRKHSSEPEEVTLN